MKRSLFLLNWLLFFMAFPSGTQVGNIVLTPKPEIPRVENGDVVIFHAGYSFLYSDPFDLPVRFGKTKTGNCLLCLF